MSDWPVYGFVNAVNEFPQQSRDIVPEKNEVEDEPDCPDSATTASGSSGYGFENLNYNSQQQSWDFVVDIPSKAQDKPERPNSATTVSDDGFEKPVYDYFVVDIPEKTEDEVQRRDSATPQNFAGTEDQEAMSLTRSRSGSMMSIVVVGTEDLEGPRNSDDSENGYEGPTTILIGPDNELARQSRETDFNLKLDSEALTYLRWYLFSTAQWLPRKIYRNPHNGWCQLFQYFIVLAPFTLSLANDFGAFGNRTLFQEHMEKNQPITLVNNVLWDLRFLVMAVLGINYNRKQHLEQLLSQLSLTREYWKKARQSIFKILVCAFCGVLLFPMALRAVQMSLQTHQGDEQFTNSEIAVNCALFVVARYCCLPIFFVFVHVVFLIYCQIRLFKSQLQQWRHDQQKIARDKLIDIKLMIRNAERAFQSFLILHMFLLLITFIPEIFSAAERLHTESHYQEKYTPTILQVANMKYPANQLIMIQRTDKDNVTHRMLYAPLLDMKTKLKPRATPTQQATLKYTPHTMTKTDYTSIIKVIAASLTDLIEIAILYSLPLVLLGKIDKLLKCLPQTIQTLKFDEQRSKGFMFQTNKDVEKMLKELTSAKSIQVLGMQINSLLAVLVTLSMPLLVTVLRIMLRYVEIDP